MMPVRIAGTGTAVPDHVVDQAMVRGIVERVFGTRVADLAHLLGVFAHDHIVERRFVRPAEWYAHDHGFAATNAVYAEEAVRLGTQAARVACAGREADVAAIVVASTTGIMTPSLDAALIATLGCSPRIARIPIFGLGCAAGVSGLARAADLCRGLGGRPVLFVAVEICSVTFQRGDASKANIVGSSLFGDGAAAVLLAADGTGPAIAGHAGMLYPDTEDIMGWDVGDAGLRVRFSRDIPTFVRANIPALVSEACTAWNIEQGAITDIIAHPGGAKVIDAYAEALGLPPERFRHATDVLRTYGNMSSASVLFVLERWLAERRANPAQPVGYAMMSALGPGFSAELLLLTD